MVAACGGSCSVLFVFIWCDRAYDSYIGNHLAFGNVLLVDEEYSICDFDTAFEALGKTGKFTTSA